MYKLLQLEEIGVIFRAEMFKFTNDNFSYGCSVTMSFLELYQEFICDRLSGKPREQWVLDIKEDIQEGIYIPGMTELPVAFVTKVLEILQVFIGQGDCFHGN